MEMRRGGDRRGSGAKGFASIDWIDRRLDGFFALLAPALSCSLTYDFQRGESHSGRHNVKLVCVSSNRVKSE